MKRFVAIECSTGRVIACAAKDAEDAYHVIGEKVYGMLEPIDTGNVDVDLYELPIIAYPNRGAVVLDMPYKGKP